MLLVGLLGHSALAEGLSVAADSDIREANGQEPLLAECLDQPGASKDATWPYATFTKNGQPHDLHGDEYIPQGAGPWPIAVLAHGGG